MMRRQVIALMGILLGLTNLGRSEFSFTEVRDQAEARARAPYHDFSPRVPAGWLHLPPDQYSAVHFDDKKARWADEDFPFGLEFYPPGIFHKQIVIIHEIDPQGVRDIPFDSDVFHSSKGMSKLPDSPGYAGFRIVRKIPHGLDEIATFLDASYFRMVGFGQNFGSSARGIALNTGSGAPEEFPVFQQFWVRRPEKAETNITVYALMDSPSITGAYRFVIHPGSTTTTDVKMAIFPRTAVSQLGLAPLTSMFLFGQNSHPPFGDVRPEVHDADGLLIHNGQGEWIWHPLERGQGTRIDMFKDVDPLGFGLIQRDRDYEHFADLEDRYQLRPSIWVQPVGKWGPGNVKLVQLESDQDSVDNIAAFWVPAIPLQAGQHLEREYQLQWTSLELVPAGLGRVQATRIGKISGTPPRLRFVVEFGGPAMTSIPETAQLSADIAYGPGTEPLNHELRKNEFDQTWRLTIDIIEPKQAVNLRAELRRDGVPLTESWNYTWRP